MNCCCSNPICRERGCQNQMTYGVPVQDSIIGLTKSSYDSLVKERDALKSELRKAHEALECAREGLGCFLGCVRVVDDATVPKAGIDKNPDQVVFNLSCSYTRIKKAEETLAQIAKILGER